MNNSELFKEVFGVYAEEFWAYPKDEMLNWLVYNVPDTNVGDLISRQAAIDLIHKTVYGFFDIVDNESEEPMSEKDKLLLEVNKAVSNGIKDLSSAQPERKKGKWIKQNPFVDTEECSLCKYNIYSEELETPFCPWCGAEMETNNAEIH